MRVTKGAIRAWRFCTRTSSRLKCGTSNVYYMEESVLLGTKPLVDSIRHFIRDPSGVFSVWHLCECRIVQWRHDSRLLILLNWFFVLRLFGLHIIKRTRVNSWTITCSSYKKIYMSKNCVTYPSNCLKMTQHMDIYLLTFWTFILPFGYKYYNLIYILQFGHIYCILFDKHTSSHVFPYTSFVLYRFLSALQQNSAQSRLLYLLNTNAMATYCVMKITTCLRTWNHKPVFDIVIATSSDDEWL